MAGRFSVEAVFKAVDRVTAPVTRMQNRVGKFTRSMDRSFHKLNRTVNKFGRGIKRGAQVAAVSLAVVSGAMAKVVSSGSEFGRAIGSAAAKFPEQIQRGTDEFRALERAARDVGSATEFTATEAAKGLNFLAKAGFNAEMAVASLGDIVNFATAAEIELAEAADIASDALGAFGMDTGSSEQKLANLNRVMDVMSKAANSSNVSVSELFESIKKGAPIATKAGQSVETFSAVAATLAGSGLKGSDVGTASKNIALALAGVGNKAAKTFKELDIPLSINGKMRDIADVFDDLSATTKNMGEEEVLSVMNAIFGKISLASAANLLGEGSKKIRKFREDFEAAGGSSRKTAEFIRNDVKGSMDSLSSAVEGVSISIFSLNKGPLKALIDGATEWVRVNEAAIATGLQEFIVKVSSAVKFLVKHRGAILEMSKWVLGAVIAFKALTAVLTVVNLLMMANPVTLVVLGIVALIAALAAVVIWWDELAAAFRRTGIGVDVMITTIGYLMGPVGWLIGAAALIFKHWEPIKAFFADLWGGVLAIFEDVVGKITAITDVIAGKAAAIVDKVSGVGAGVASFFGFDGDEDETGRGSPAPTPQIVSPQERVARQIDEQRTTSSAEVTLRDETGRAEVTGGALGPGIMLQPAGAF